jgi:hypothetical protein
MTDTQNFVNEFELAMRLRISPESRPEFAHHLHQAYGIYMISHFRSFGLILFVFAVYNGAQGWCLAWSVFAAWILPFYVIALVRLLSGSQVQWVYRPPPFKQRLVIWAITSSCVMLPVLVFSTRKDPNGSSWSESFYDYRDTALSRIRENIVTLLPWLPGVILLFAGIYRYFHPKTRVLHWALSVLAVAACFFLRSVADHVKPGRFNAAAHAVLDFTCPDLDLCVNAKEVIESPWYLFPDKTLPLALAVKQLARPGDEGNSQHLQDILKLQEDRIRFSALCMLMFARYCAVLYGIVANLVEHAIYQNTLVTLGALAAHALFSISVYGMMWFVYGEATTVVKCESVDVQCMVHKSLVYIGRQIIIFGGPTVAIFIVICFIVFSDKTRLSFVGQWLGSLNACAIFLPHCFYMCSLMMEHNSYWLENKSRFNSDHVAVFWYTFVALVVFWSHHKSVVWGLGISVLAVCTVILTSNGGKLMVYARMVHPQCSHQEPQQGFTVFADSVREKTANAAGTLYSDVAGSKIAQDLWSLLRNATSSFSSEK